MSETTWHRISRSPERWERFGYGAIEARGDELWAVLPVCGHPYMVLSLAEALRQVEERDGLCYGCCSQHHAFQ